MISLLKKKERARLKLKKTGNELDYFKFSKLRSESKNKISECYKNYVSYVQANMHSNPKLFWAFTKSKRQTNSYPSSFNFQDTTSTNPRVICQMFSDYFMSTYNANNTNVINDHSTITNDINVSPDLSPFLLNRDSVEKLLSTVDINKNGGPDGIPNIFLKQTCKQLSIPLTITYL